MLHVANIGDCRLLVWRDGKVVLHTTEQLHDFNYPYQLGARSSVQPTDAAVLTLQLRPGDVIVLGSDGLFDNMTDQQVGESVAAAHRRANPPNTRKATLALPDPSCTALLLYL